MGFLALLLSAVSLQAGQTSLAVRVWPHGVPGRNWSATLACAPARGTVRSPGAACRRLLALDQPFAPTPPDSFCTQIYGGPQVARVRGTFRGARVDTVFRRSDGCDIARWNRVAFLFASPR